MKNLLKYIGAALLLCLVAFNIFAADPLLSITPSGLGGIEYSRNNYFHDLTPGGRNLLDLAGDVGGVMFTGVASPVGNAIGKTVSLNYDTSRDDGHRLQVTIGTTTVNSGLWDWELVPIARYVNGTTWAAMSLLDKPNENDSQELRDKAANAEKEKKHVYWASYNPGLGDTLVGINLFLVDAMLVRASPNSKIVNITNTKDFPVIPNYNDSLNIKFSLSRFQNSLGFGADSWKSGLKSAFPLESKIAVPKSDILELSPPSAEVMSRVGSGGWNTYIFSDDGMPITYQLNGDKIEFDGHPVYQFMKIESYKVFLRNSVFLWNSTGWHPFLMTVTITPPATASIRDSNDLIPYSLALKYHLDKGYRISRIEEKYVFVSDLNNYMQENYEAIKRINPVVYNHAEKTCHWSAFFLAVKGGRENTTEEWERFWSAICAKYPYNPVHPEQNEYPEPSYKTPRLWIAD